MNNESNFTDISEEDYNRHISGLVAEPDIIYNTVKQNVEVMLSNGVSVEEILASQVADAALSAKQITVAQIQLTVLINLLRDNNVITEEAFNKAFEAGMKDWAKRVDMFTKQGGLDDAETT